MDRDRLWPVHHGAPNRAGYLRIVDPTRPRPRPCGGVFCGLWLRLCCPERGRRGECVTTTHGAATRHRAQGSLHRSEFGRRAELELNAGPKIWGRKSPALRSPGHPVTRSPGLRSPESGSYRTSVRLSPEIWAQKTPSDGTGFTQVRIAVSAGARCNPAGRYQWGKCRPVPWECHRCGPNRCQLTDAT